MPDLHELGLGEPGPPVVFVDRHERMASFDWFTTDPNPCVTVAGSQQLWEGFGECGAPSETLTHKQREPDHHFLCSCG